MKDRLNAGNMSKSFGERQKKLHDTEIKQKDGYLGPFSQTRKVVDIRKMCFHSTDNGPFWMTLEEMEQTWKDAIITTKTKI
jgi:hypothetical protein